VPDSLTREALLDLARAYQPACVLMAAAELDVFSHLAKRPMAAANLASAVQGDLRATTVLADALAAMRVLQKQDGVYSVPPPIVGMLLDGNPESVLPMLRHQANCLRNWIQLSSVVRTGRPAERRASIRGAEADRAAFIEAMEVASREAAPRVVAALGPPPFRHLLDVGGGPGTWTIAFLRAVPGARATLYDLPATIPIARKHVEAAGLGDRVTFAEGDFAVDPNLPRGADLAWVSAIVHQNSRQENRTLLAKVHAALVDGGRIMIRDIVMDDTHTTPVAGALFAINMLVGTEGGGTYSLSELTEGLHGAGFDKISVIRGERDMDSVIQASRV
jgi:precorrin-6B methylase 2